MYLLRDDKRCLYSIFFYSILSWAEFLEATKVLMGFIQHLKIRSLHDVTVYLYEPRKVENDILELFLK